MKINVRQAEGVSDVSVFLTEHEADGVAKALRSRLEGDVATKAPAITCTLKTARARS
jgi:hypothetical protein